MSSDAFPSRARSGNGGATFLACRRRPTGDGGPTKGFGFRGGFGTYGHAYLFLSRGPLRAPLGGMAAATPTQQVAVLEPTPTMDVLTIYIYIYIYIISK